MNDMDNERREHQRAPLKMPVEYKKLEDFFVDYAVDISQGGIFIATEEPVEVGEKVSVKFSVPDEDMQFESTGTVVRSTDAPQKGFAIKFDPLADDAKAIIEMLWEVKLRGKE